MVKGNYERYRYKHYDELDEEGKKLFADEYNEAYYRIRPYLIVIKADPDDDEYILYPLWEDD